MNGESQARAWYKFVFQRINGKMLLWLTGQGINGV